MDTLTAILQPRNQEASKRTTLDKLRVTMKNRFTWSYCTIGSRETFRGGDPHHPPPLNISDIVQIDGNTSIGSEVSLKNKKSDKFSTAL